MNILVVPHEIAELHTFDPDDPSSTPVPDRPYTILPPPTSGLFAEVVKLVRKADVIYCWINVEGQLPSRTMEVLHAALILDKPCYAGITGSKTLTDYHAEYFKAAVLSPLPLEGLDKLMETSHFTDDVRRGPRRMESKWDGICRVCGGSYRAGSRISWDPTKRGATHVDCGATDSAEPLPPSVLKSIVEELRKQNSALEQECTKLVGRNRVLEQRLTAKKG